MTAGWVAAATRGRALVRHRTGPGSGRSIAGADWDAAPTVLAGTVHGRRLPPDADRDTARRAAMAATLWQLRVLAGWLPPGQGGLARLFAAPLELANIEGHLSALTGGRPERPLTLGSLAVAWPRVAATDTPQRFRAVLARSVWGDPGGTDPAAVALGLRLGLARRLAARPGPTGRWATGGAAVLVARERFGFGRPLTDESGRVADALIGRRWRRAASLSTLVGSLPPSGAWPFIGVDDPDQLWRAEVELARTVEREAGVAASSGRARPATVIGAMALLLVDLRRVVAAIDLAGLGPDAVEVLDAVA
jgi:hypothetical protein